MYKNLVLFLCMVNISAYAKQDSTTVYIKSDGHYTRHKDSASIIRVIINPEVGVDLLYTIHDYYPNGEPKLITHAKNTDGSGFNGACTEYFSNGIKKNDEIFKDDELVGALYAYYPTGKSYMSATINTGGFLIIECFDSNGQALAIGGDGEFVEYDENRLNITGRGPIHNGVKDGEWLFYKNGVVIENKRFDKGTDVSKNFGISTNPEVAAQFQGGMEALLQFISSRTHYTDMAKRENISGRVFVSFIVEVDGSVTDIKVVRSLGYGLDEQVVGAIKLTSKKWKPGMQSGRPIKSQYTLPVYFGR